MQTKIYCNKLKPARAKVTTNHCQSAGAVRVNLFHLAALSDVITQIEKTTVWTRVSVEEMPAGSVSTDDEGLTEEPDAVSVVWLQWKQYRTKLH